MELFWLAFSTILIGVFGCVAWFWGSNLILDRIYPPRGSNAGDNIRKAGQIRPWLFLGPAILFLGVYLVYPIFDSLWRSVHNARGTDFVGGSNYAWLLNDGKFRESMRNNLVWLLVVPALSTLFARSFEGYFAKAITLYANGAALNADLADLDTAGEFIPRHIGIAPADEARMLPVIGS